MTVANGYASTELAEAHDAVTAAEAAERTAFDQVDFMREEFSVGRVKRGEWQKAQRALAGAQEATAVARAKVRAVTRDEQAQRALAEAMAVEAWRLVVPELVKDRAALERELKQLLVGILASFEDLDNRIVAWNRRATHERPIVGPNVRLASPGTLRTVTDTIPYGRLDDGVRTLLRLYAPNRR